MWEFYTTIVHKPRTTVETLQNQHKSYRRTRDKTNLRWSLLDTIHNFFSCPFHLLLSWVRLRKKVWISRRREGDIEPEDLWEKSHNTVPLAPFLFLSCLGDSIWVPEVETEGLRVVKGRDNNYRRTTKQGRFNETWRRTTGKMVQTTVPMMKRTDCGGGSRSSR